ncbi:helix-turn-helix domain-containing protein [Streptomyces sp. G35A]
MSGWEAGLDDDEAGAVVRTVARQPKPWREAAGLTQAEFGAAIEYGEELVSPVERGRRIPRPEYLDAADEVLGAGGKIAALKQDVAEVRYPKKVRDSKKLEAEAVELGAYNNSVVHGLLRTEDYARAVFDAHRPAPTEDEAEQQVAARLARRGILDLMTGRRVLGLGQCESTLRRPRGGRMVMRRQLRRLLEVAQLRNVDLQVLPLDREVNSRTGGSFRLLELRGGTTVAFSESPLSSRAAAGPGGATVLDVRYGAPHAQALSPQDSLPLIEKALGGTRT